MPDSWFEQLVTYLANQTRRRLGAPEIDRQRVRPLRPAEQNVAGLAEWESRTIAAGAHMPAVLSVVLQGVRTASALDWTRQTLATLVHEAVHLTLPPSGDTRGAEAYATPAGTFLEEGVTELATQDLLPDVLTGFEGTIPGVAAAQPDRRDVYPNYVPAVRTLVGTIRGLPLTGDRRVIHELARVGPERKFDLLVEQAMDGFGLTPDVAARGRIRAALEQHVDHNAPWMIPPDPRNPGNLATKEPAGLSKIMGAQMSIELRRQLHLEGEREGITMELGWRDQLIEQAADRISRLGSDPDLAGPEARTALDRWAGRLDDRSRRPDIGEPREGLSAPTRCRVLPPWSPRTPTGPPLLRTTRRVAARRRHGRSRDYGGLTR